MIGARWCCAQLEVRPRVARLFDRRGRVVGAALERGVVAVRVPDGAGGSRVVVVDIGTPHAGRCAGAPPARCAARGRRVAPLQRPRCGPSWWLLCDGGGGACA